MLQTINVGAAANDHTGDSLRAAFIKTNQVLAYSFGTHNWGNTDWKAAMMDWIDANAPSYWLQNGAGDISYTPPGAGSPALVVGANGTVSFADATTLTPDGSGHLFYNGQLGSGITVWDRYPYEAGVFYNPPTAASYPDTKLGIYSFYDALDGGAGASLTFGFPYASDNNSHAPGFELQMISDPDPDSTFMRFNCIGRDPSSGSVVDGSRANRFLVYGNGNCVAAGDLYTTNLHLGGGLTTASGGPVWITPTGSGFSWTNDTGLNVFVMIGGGVVTDIGLNGGGLFTGVSLTGITTLPLQPGESFYVYYSSTPTIYYKPF